MPERSWRFRERREVSDHRIFKIHLDRYRVLPSGQERDFVVIDAPDWINVVPLTADGNVVMIRQFRHGVRQLTLEIPGGMIDPGESPDDAAARELLEETGYRGEALRKLVSTFPNPAVQNNTLHCFVAENVRRVAAPRPDEFERIEVVEVPVTQLPELARSGAIGHSLVLVALGMLGLVHR
jgi:8-oxo-dGTP pyrophosphatase MutT (NUDIX family)